MKALVYHGYHDMRLEERPVPVPQDDEVLIKVRVASVCGTDTGIYQLKEPTKRFYPPLVLGHEFTGEIAACGRNAKKYPLGTRVAADPQLYCGECFYCQRGDINMCANRASLGTSIGKTTDGSMQEYFAIRESAIIPLDPRVSDEEGSMLEPLAVCYYAALLGSFGKGERVLVSGATGPIGLFVIKFLKIMGASCIIASGRTDWKLEYAKKCGADEIVNIRNKDLEKTVRDLTDGVGVDRVIIAAGEGTAIPESYKLVRNGGRIVVVAINYCDVTIDPVQLVVRNISIMGSYMFRHEQQLEVMNMLAEGKLKAGDIITSTCPLSEGVQLFEKLVTTGSKDIKVLITA